MKDEAGNLVLSPYDCFTLALVSFLMFGGCLFLGFILGWWLM